jgi:DNA polymerase-1
MINVHRRLQQQQQLHARLLLQIHDELLLEAPQETLDSLERLVVEEMSNAAQLAVPLKVDVKRGVNWAEVE